MLAHLLSIAIVGEITPAQMLASDVLHAVPLDSARVLCADGNGSFFVLDAVSGERREWSSSWQPGREGWEVRDGYESDGCVFDLGVSPDGGHVVFAQGVWLPSAVDVPEDREGMRGCFVVVVCDADGGNAVPVAIGVEVGGGPDYDFTADSRRLVGQPFYPCDPTPRGYAEYLRAGWDSPTMERFDYYDVETGRRGTIPGLQVSDGYWKCPYSDYFRIENNWYEEHDFSSFETGGLVGHYSVPDGEGWIRGWIRPDAVLMAGPENWRVVFVDGTVVDGPPTSWDLYCWMPDGSYLFSTDGGQTVLHGKVDWTTGEVADAVPCPGLEVYVEDRFIPMPGSKGVLVLSSAWSYRSGFLGYFELP